jgi:hypothetical protein
MYKLTQSEIIIRLADSAFIPNDPRNSDRAEYQRWLAAGNTPIPVEAVSPEVLADAARKEAIDQAIAGDTTIQSLKRMTNAEFDAWWSENVTNASQAIAVLKRIARVVLRRLL